MKRFAAILLALLLLATPLPAQTVETYKGFTLEIYPAGAFYLVLVVQGTDYKAALAGTSQQHARSSARRWVDLIGAGGAGHDVFPSAIPLPLAEGGTAAITAAAARISLDLELGVDVQAHDSDLDTLSSLSDGGWVIENQGDNDLGIGDPTAVFTITTGAPAASLLINAAGDLEAAGAGFSGVVTFQDALNMDLLTALPTCDATTDTHLVLEDGTGTNWQLCVCQNGSGWGCLSLGFG